MPNRSLRIGPISLAAAVANIYVSPTTTGGTNVEADVTATYTLIKHIRVVNRTGAAVNVSLFIGATGVGAAGTEFAWSAAPVPANGWLDWYSSGQGLRLTTTDFLTGFAGSVNALTLVAEGELGIAG
jgi:hypothetical protein